MLKINETPIRTSKIFGINNIKLESTEIPNTISEFDGLTIIGDASKFDIENNILDYDIKYGLGNELINQIKAKSNKKIKLIIKDRVENPICLNFDFDEDNKDLIDNIEIISNTNTKSTIIIKYISNTDDINYHNGMIKLISNQNSEIDIIILNLLNTKSNHFLSIDAELKENAKSNFNIFDLGGKNNITNYYSALKGNKSNNKINNIYLGNENQLFDINYISELYGEESNINMEIQGALNGNAVKNFKGTIDFKKGSKKAKGDENEFCMLLSKGARSKALPILLCSEEDVEGNHSSSAGKVDEKALFYIMSRGLSYKEAMKLIVKTKFSKILDSIELDELREEINSEIDRRL